MGKKVGFNTGKGGYGDFLYFTSIFSTAKGYGTSPNFKFPSGAWNSPQAGNVILVCNVTCGNAHNVPPGDVVPWPAVTKSQWAGVPLRQGEHSRIIDKPSSGADECGIERADQALVTHIITFD